MVQSCQVTCGTQKSYDVKTLYKEKSLGATTHSRASVDPNFENGNIYALDTLPSKILCRIFSYLNQSDLRSCRLVKTDIKHAINHHFILNAVLSDENLLRPWSPGIFLPWTWRRTRTSVQVLETDTIYNKICYLKIGRLKKSLPGTLENVAATVRHIEFTQPLMRKNINKIMKECQACTNLTIHTSVFIGMKPISCCPKRKSLPKYAEIAAVAHQLKRLHIILDDATMGVKLPCTVPYSLTVSLNPPEDEMRRGVCEILFIPEGGQNVPEEVHKTWVIDDQIIDLYSRPDCLRKLTYFSRTTQAELRQIKVKFIPDLSFPATVRCANVIHHPAFYPQLKKYPTGPFNGTILTYFKTDRKQIMTYRPLHILSEVLVMSFPEAALLLVSERRSAYAMVQESPEPVLSSVDNLS